MAITQLASLGDSLTQGTVPFGPGGFSTYQGGLGCWLELAAERLGNRPDIGPLISPGFRQVHLGLAADNEWLSSGTWTQTTTSDLFDRAPFGRAFYSTDSSATYTFTSSTKWRPIVGFDLFWIDYTKTGSIGGDWQYSLDGGTSWTNMGQPILHDQKLKKFYVNSPITGTLKVRPFDGTSAVGALPVGITPYFIDPRTATKGFIWHNLGSGAQTLQTNCNPTTAGDRLAWFDDVTLGTGSPISHQPSIITNMFINDVNVSGGTATTWGNALDALYTRFHTYARILFLSPYEANPGVYSTTTQASLRSKTKERAAANGQKYLDIFDAWNNLGINNNADADAQGFLYDLTHETQAGHIDMAERLFRSVQINYFPALTVIEDFTNSSSQVGEFEIQGGRSTAIKKMTGLTRPSLKGVNSLDSRYVKTWLGLP